MLSPVGSLRALTPIPLLLLSLALLALATLAPAPAARAATTAIEEGELVWGVKESWRNYIGSGTVSEGATVNADGTYAFPVSSGSFDDETNTTIVEFDGRVHWQSYPDFLGPGKWGLDTTFTDLRLEIGPTAQVLRGTHIGYLRSDPGGELHVDEDVVLAKLQIEGATTSFAGGAAAWSGIPALAGPGFSLYVEGTELDPLSVEYVGPGGVPDLGEKWNHPGQVVLEEQGRWVSPGTSASFTQSQRRAFASGQAGVVHIADVNEAGSPASILAISAHDPVSLEQVGTPLGIANSTSSHYFKFGFDPASDSLYYVTAVGFPATEVTVRRARWNPGSESYDGEVVGQLPGAAQVGSVVWNPVREELGVVARPVGTSGLGFGHIADLYTFREEAGAWQADHDPLVVPATGQLEGLGKKIPASVFNIGIALSDSNLEVARDGSYVQAPGAVNATVAAGAKVPMPALRIEPDDEGVATVSPIWETQLPVEPDSTYYSWGRTVLAADGAVLLHDAGQRLAAYQRVDIGESGETLVGDVVDAPQGELLINWFGSSMAGDPQRGWEWATDVADPDGYTVNVLVDDEVVSRLAYPEASRDATIDVGPDGALYLPVEDEATGRNGYQRLAIKGLMPTIGAQPGPAQVSLGAEEESEVASFTSTVEGGEPATTRQWQVKPAGESSFVDLDGERDATLIVDAERGMNGNQYRAVYSSDAGQIVSGVATLSVEYAPSLVSEPKSVAVTEGADAVFLVAADGNPEPAVEWQRRVSGFWQDIDPGDDNFVVNGPSLTVLDTNTDQSGALFRAKLANSAGAVFSKTAKLTVSPKVTIPDEGLDLENVTLEWTGSAEMQKVPFFGDSNFFSAGTSDGEEATYSAFAENAAVYQVSSAGAEALATWATRAAHVSNGGKQLVRLHGGEARVEPDGSATVAWNGAFSVNFYGGLVPFTFTDPELTIDDEGSGTLSAGMSGCESSQANPSQCTPFAAAPDVTVATFSGVEVDPAGEVSIEPDYAGVEVTVPVPYAPQNRVAPGWGAWPQSFVDFQVKTGLSSHWYSSGGIFDPYKEPDPFTVDFDGEALPDEPAPAPPGLPKPPADGLAPGGEAAEIAAVGRIQALAGNRLATIAILTCPDEGFCAVTAPRKVKLKIAGKAHWAKVIAPRTIDGGDSAAVKVKLSPPALRGLRHRTATGRITLSMRSLEGSVRRVLVVRIRKGG